MAVLSDEQVEQFRDRGFVRLEGVFGEGQAAEQRDLIWSELRDVYRVIEGDRSTWRQPAKQLRRTRDDPKHLTMGTDRLVDALDGLLGEDDWTKLGPEHWGSVLFTFPNAEAWDVPQKTWHWDNPIPPHLDGCTAVHVFSLLAPLEPGGGATVFIEGMHRVLIDYFTRLSPEEKKSKHAKHRQRAMKSDPWLRRLQTNEPSVANRVKFFMEEGTRIGDAEVRVHEMTGNAGDVYFIHPLLAHTWAPNASERPRMMRAKLVMKNDFDWSYMLPPAKHSAPPST